MTVLTAAEVYRDFETDGVPSSGAHKPKKSEIRALLGGYERFAHIQRSVTATPIVVADGDQMLNCNIGSPGACTLPAAASRGGAPLTFKDVGAQAFLNPITFTTTGGETIDGQAFAVLNRNRQALTFYPFNDGVNSGWFIA